MSSSSHGSAKVILFALLANVGIAISKFIAASFTGSAAMLAEGIHSLADCTNQVLLMIGHKAAIRAPSAKHPLGYGRENFFWSFVVALILFSMGGLFAIKDGYHKLHETHQLEKPLILLLVLAFAVVLESMSFYACYREVRAKNRHGSLAQWFRKTTQADLLVIFTEDLAALAGLVLAAASVAATWITGDARWDAVGSIAIGVLLVIVSILLAVELKSLLIGEAAEITQEDVGALVQKHIPGGRILRFISIQCGVGEVLLAYKIHPGQVNSVPDLVTKMNALEKDVKEKFSEVKWQFVEPDDHA